MEDQLTGAQRYHISKMKLHELEQALEALEGAISLLGREQIDTRPIEDALWARQLTYRKRIAQLKVIYKERLADIPAL